MLKLLPIKCRVLLIDAARVTDNSLMAFMQQIGGPIWWSIMIGHSTVDLIPIECGSAIGADECERVRHQPDAAGLWPWIAYRGDRFLFGVDTGWEL